MTEVQPDAEGLDSFSRLDFTKYSLPAQYTVYFETARTCQFVVKCFADMSRGLLD